MNADTAGSWLRALHRMTLLIGALGAAASASASQATAPCSEGEFEIRQRAPGYQGATLGGDYAEEHRYIRKRRGERADGAVGPPENLTGLAISGGGIRAASVGLGVLQALEEQGLLERLDYLSAVSGGAYIASWLQAHLGAEQGARLRDQIEVEVGARSPAELLHPHRDHVEHLRAHAGFLRRGSFWEGSRIVGAYLWRWPCALFVDVFLHLKTPVNNFCHPIAIYRDRLERTYLRAREDLLLPQMNHEPLATPYLILNGNLTNWGNARSGAEKRSALEPYNFEFTRDFSGSDGTGYVDSRAFGRRVLGVTEDEAGIPRCVRVATRERAAQPLPKGPADPDPDRLERVVPDPGELSSALAASGAAFDPDGIIVSIGSVKIRGAASVLGAPFNLNVGLEAENFARGHDGLLGSLYDYLRMLTWQRLPFLVRTDARWIKVTDGGHYDNLGIAALARRGVACIVAFDATADPDFEYGDLKRLGERLASVGLRILEPRPAERVSTAEFTIVPADSGSPAVARLLYLKSNAEDDAPHLSDASDEEVLRIRGFRDHNEPYPHTPTFRQWYTWEQFEAYRILGHRMATFHLRSADLRGCHFAASSETSRSASR